MNKPPYFDKAFEHFWYDEQFVSYITQFMAIFSGMYVKIGKNNFNSQTDLVEIPIRYGGVDRVVESILSANTQNKPLRLPLFSARLIEIQPAPERYKGVATSDRHSFLPRGGSLKNDVKVVRRRTPIPYKMVFELNIFTSNESQKFQILEQILPIFDPSIQIQTSDSPFDGGKITVLTLENLGSDQNYPSGTDRRLVITSMIFSTYGWLQVPINFKDDFIKSIHMRLKTFDAGTRITDEIMDDNSTENTAEMVIDIDKMPDFPEY